MTAPGTGPTLVGAMIDHETRELTCQECHRPFSALVRLLRGEPRNVPTLCAVCHAATVEARHQLEVEAQRAAKRAQLAASLTQRLESLNIPPIFESATLESFEHHGSPDERMLQARVVQIARRYLGLWPRVDLQVLFQGAPGTGKGHIAYSLAKAVIAQHGGTARVVKLTALIRDLREPWRDKKGPSEEQRLAQYRRADLLVIDEVSRHAFYGKEIHQHLYDVLDARLEWSRPTILTTNETEDGIRRILGPALWDRLAGYGGVVEFGTASWRTRTRETT